MNSVQTTLLCAAFAVDTQPTALLPADSAAAFKLSSAAGEAANQRTTPSSTVKWRSPPNARL
jgi:hypothetical protein